MSGRFGVKAIEFRLFPSRTPEVEVTELEVIERAVKSAEPMPAMVSIEEAKRITSLSRETIYALRDKGIIRTVTLPSGRTLVSRSDLGRL